MDFINGISTQLTPLAKNIERGFGQARQYANEKLGTADDLTELPTEYIGLERKVDSLHTTLVAVLKTHGISTTSVIPAAVTDTVTSLSKTLRDTAAPVLAQTPAPASPETTPNHTLARACYLSADALGQEPLAPAFQKIGLAEEKLGDAAQSLKLETVNKFTTPLTLLVNERIADVNRARRNVTNTRLQLDSVKSRFKAASPQRAEALQMELEKAEDVFVDAVEEATKLMKAFIDSPATLRHIGDLIAQNIAYHKLCVQTWSELAPEIEEMQVAQQAMYPSTDGF